MAHAAKSLRLFFAVWPDDAARIRLATVAGEVAAQRGGRATPAENLHVTVAFLGTVAADRIDPLGNVASAARAGIEPFELILDRVGGAGSQIAWLAPSTVPPVLARLHENLVDALAQQGFEADERRYRPHVTLARRCVRPARRGGVEPVRWIVDRFAMVASTPQAGGSRYDELAGWSLQSTSTV